MQLTTTQLKSLFLQWAVIMQNEKDHLIELDSIIGDGDLGLTMSDVFFAAYQAIEQSDETDIGKLFYFAGKAVSTVVSESSTMGALMASGLMQVGKEFKGKSAIETSEFDIVFAAYFDGVKARGKANIGEKTFLDGLYPAIHRLSELKNDDWLMAAEKALISAKQGVNATKNMVAIHGRAAIQCDASRAQIDPGAYVAQLLIQGYYNFVQQSVSN